MKLTRPQQKMLQPMVVYGWPIYHHSSTSKQGYWDNDSRCPVKIGPVLASLVDAGLVDRVGANSFGTVLYKLSSGVKYRFLCHLCREGSLYNNEGEYTGKCHNCIDGCIQTARS